MDVIENVYFTIQPELPFLSPFRMHFTQGGKIKTWDMVEAYDSVLVVVFNVSRRVLVLVKQFRPAVYFNALHPDDRFKQVDTAKYPGSLGIAIELCGGKVPEDKTAEDAARDKVLKACGYDVPPSAFNTVTSYRVGVGVSGSIQTLVFCEVTDQMRVGSGSSDDNPVEVVEQTIPQTERFLSSPPLAPLPCPPASLFALTWFLHYKAQLYRKSYERTCTDCKMHEG